MTGELIAVEENELVVLSIETGICIVYLNRLNNFSIQYAHGKNLDFAIPISMLVTISHGFFLILTAPINLISTAIIASKKTPLIKLKNLKSLTMT